MFARCRALAARALIFPLFRRKGTFIAINTRIKPYRHRSVLTSTITLVSGIILFLSLASQTKATGSATLQWDQNPEPDIAGYRLFYGPASGSYDQQIDVGNTTASTVSNLADGGTYFFVVTAYNTAGMQSLPSNEVSATVADPGGQSDSDAYSRAGHHCSAAQSDGNGRPDSNVQRDCHRIRIVNLPVEKEQRAHCRSNRRLYHSTHRLTPDSRVG